MVRDVGSFHASGSFRFFTSVLHFREMQEGAATPWPDHFSFQPRADGGLSAAQDRAGIIAGRARFPLEGLTGSNVNCFPGKLFRDALLLKM